MTATCVSQTFVAARQRGLAPVAILFMACLAVPIILQLGSIRLSPYRIVLLAMCLPCIWAWLSGAMGRAQTPDLLVLGIAGWSALSFLHVHGVRNGLEAAGIVFIETLIPYLLARLYIRSLDDFLAMVRMLVVVVMILLPFAIIETVSGWNSLIDAIGSMFPTFPDVAKPLRLGLDRVQGPFEHPILFGVFCGSALALGFYAFRQHRLLITAAVFLTSALSLSSGPMAALVAQVGMIAWDRTFLRHSSRWIWLIALSIAAYVTVDLISNRSPVEVFISHLAFNSDTAYNRILIWEWGWVNIWQNPWFGLGNGDWQRLWFMTPSVDMFWIQRAMVHGLPVGLFYQLVFIWLICRLVRLQELEERTSRCRAGLVICYIGLYCAGMTVHFWNATFVWLMFLMGSAGWLLDSNRLVGLRPDPAELLYPTSPKGILDPA